MKYEEYKKNALKDLDVKAAYDELCMEYEMIQKQIDADKESIEKSDSV